MAGFIPGKQRRKVCAELGDGWRLPADNEWAAMVDEYGGSNAFGSAPKNGKAAYKALIEGGK